MNQTAKKLRDIAQNAGVTPGSGKPYSVIATIKSAFGFDSILAAGVLLQFMGAIADELDELQARAAGANNLRQRLDSAEKKAERRKKQVERTEDAIRERNARLKMRGETVARLTAENGELRKQVPSEREREILDMWPRFEEGEPVMVGDRFIDHRVNERTVRSVIVNDDGVELRTFDGTFDWHETGERVKRPAPKVLDADGVEIRAGDTVWFRRLSTGDRMRKVTVTGFGEHSLDGPLATLKDEMGWTCHIDPKKVTHVQPDSWERLEEDAEFNDETGIVGGNLDIVRRAKALAGVEVD